MWDKEKLDRITDLIRSSGVNRWPEICVNYPRLKPWACHSKFRADSSPAVSFRHGARSPKTDSTDDYRLIDATHNMIVCLLLFYARIPPTPALVPLPLHSLKGWASCGTPAEAGYVVKLNIRKGVPLNVIARVKYGSKATADEYLFTTTPRYDDTRNVVVLENPWRQWESHPVVGNYIEMDAELAIKILVLGEIP